MSQRLLEIAAVITIFLLAAVLRLGWAGTNSFAFDEARLSLIALEMARDGELARVGMPSSVGVPNLPAAAWIFSIPYFISPDPLVATQFVGLLGVIAVIGVWWWARRVWGLWAGLVAGLFMAASPFAVLYSRSIWAQNLLPILALCWASTALLSITRERSWALLLHIFLTGFIWQVHFAGIGLILPTVYFFFRFRWWRNGFAVVLGAVLVLITLLPFISALLCCRPDLLSQFAAALGGETAYDLQSYGQLIQLGIASDWGYLLLGDLQAPIPPLLPITVGVILLFGLGTVVRQIAWVRRNKSNASISPANTPGTRVMAEILLVWLLLPPLFFVRHSTPVFIHYQLMTLPALALLAGFSTQLVNRFSPVVLGIMVLISAGWAVLLGQGLTLASTLETPNGLGTPLYYSRQAAQSIAPDLSVRFFTHGDDANVDGEAAVFEALWWGKDHQIVPGGSVLILPNEPAQLMATLRYIQAWEELVNADLIGDEWTAPRREGTRPFVGAAYGGERDPAGFTMVDNPVQLSDGTQLIGWKVRWVGPRLRISTLWDVIAAPPPGVYQQFHHLYDGIDAVEPLHIADVPIVAHHWRVGDQLIIMGDFFVDDLDAFWIDVGHYTLPAVDRVPRADGSDGSVRLGPLMIDPRQPDD